MLQRHRHRDPDRGARAHTHTDTGTVTDTQIQTQIHKRTRYTDTQTNTHLDDKRLVGRNHYPEKIDTEVKKLYTAVEYHNTEVEILQRRRKNIGT